MKSIKNNSTINKYLLTLLCLPLILIGYFMPFKISEDMTIQCSYMAYACGDCYEQYRVDSLPSKDFTTFVNQNIKIIYADATLEKEIEKKIEKCVICYNFFLTGHFQKSFHNGTCFKIKDAHVKQRKNCCDK